MVKGLDRFREHFANYTDRYVLIGGSACDLAFEEAGVDFRATKDLDIVLCIEALDAAFARAFWDFVKLGGYEFQEAVTGERKFYRFKKPKDKDFPFMLELFSRVPDALGDVAGGTLTPIPVEDEVSSLSAILLDGEYYDWIHAGKRLAGGIPVVRPEHLIPLKARAWLDLRERAASGAQVDTHDIRKHRNDVFRLLAIVDPEFRAVVTPRIEADVRRFIEEVGGETIDLKAMGVRAAKEALMRVLARLFLKESDQDY